MTLPRTVQTAEGSQIQKISRFAAPLISRRFYFIISRSQFPSLSQSENLYSRA
jgi:hypothetical protein